MDRHDELRERLRQRSAHVVVLGLGYAGLPIAVALADGHYTVTGVDIDAERVASVNRGRSPVSTVSSSELARLTGGKKLRATTCASCISEADVILVCVPTPLTSDRQPDLSFVRAAAREVGARLCPGTLVVLQSTVPPGTTRDIVAPILEGESGLHAGQDFFLAFAPERIDPGSSTYSVRNTPKVVGGLTPLCTELATLLFSGIIDRVVPVSSPEVAEMAKVLENTFRFINISFINELAIVCDRIGIDIWETIAAAATKPFAFLPHYPGPGIGGQCIPVVPAFLEAVARQHGLASRFIETARSIDEAMPRFVVQKLERVLAGRGIALEDARVLLLGITYKPDVPDIRESPSLRVLNLLLPRSAQVDYHDPYIPYLECCGHVLRSLSLKEIDERWFDCAVLLTAHRSVDYARVSRRVSVIFDTRNHLTSSESVEVVKL